MADNGKTFTQEEVNAIVSGRVNEIESRYSGYVSAEDHQKEVDRANGLQTKLDGIEKANKLSEMRSVEQYTIFGVSSNHYILCPEISSNTIYRFNISMYFLHNNYIII